jgi:hypothetical protein
MKDAQPRSRTQSRPVERDYLAALADAVPLETWREICREAAERAKAGDAKARDWLSRLLLGEKPMRLLSLAGDECAGHTAEEEVEREARRRATDRALSDRLLF